MNTVSHLTGKSRQLDRKAAPDELVREEDVTDPPRLAKLLTRIVKDIAGLLRSYSPRRTDFEDVTFETGETVRLPHGFGGRVRWWVVDASFAVPGLVKNGGTDDDTLVLEATSDFVATIRVEAAG